MILGEDDGGLAVSPNSALIKALKSAHCGLPFHCSARPLSDTLIAEKGGACSAQTRLEL